MTAYYNENHPKTAAWLRELIRERVIAYGDVDERSIEDVAPNDLADYTQCHFFAGIGGWSYALRLAGWPDDRAVWTGSCPCQPFSAAGKGKGFADERHLWPSWHYLIEQLTPSIVFGEQVASKAGRGWFDLVYSDMEEAGYACAAVDICAASVGAPHIRQRLYWVAHSNSTGLEVEREQQARRQLTTAERSGKTYGLGDASGKGSWRNPGAVLGAQGGAERGMRSQPNIVIASSWVDCEWIYCRDGKARPIEPGAFPLAHGVPGRVGLLRGYGNAIVPQVAAAFIEATGLV